MLNSVAIEFDTCLDGAYSDPNGNHVAVQGALNGGANSCNHSSAALIAINSNIPTLSDGKLHLIDIEYFPGKLTVSMDNRVLLTPSLFLDRYITGG